MAGLSYRFIVAASQTIQIVKEFDPSNLIFLLHGPKVLNMLRRSFDANLRPQSIHCSFSFPFHLDLLGPVLHGVNLPLKKLNFSFQLGDLAFAYAQLLRFSQRALLLFFHFIFKRSVHLRPLSARTLQRFLPDWEFKEIFKVCSILSEWRIIDVLNSPQLIFNISHFVKRNG
jgi:hypothetical protein